MEYYLEIAARTCYPNHRCYAVLVHNKIYIHTYEDVDTVKILDIDEIYDLPENLLLFNIDYIDEYMNIEKDILLEDGTVISYLISGCDVIIEESGVAFTIDYRICLCDNYEFSGYTDYPKSEGDNFLTINGTDVYYIIEEMPIIAGETENQAYLTFIYGEYNYFIKVQNYIEDIDVTEDNLTIFLGDLLI